ncbi:hypothetical protein Tco_1201864 [Tanacetum coccineum]
MFERIISKGRRLEDLVQKKLGDLKDNHKFRGGFTNGVSTAILNLASLDLVEFACVVEFLNLWFYYVASLFLHAVVIFDIEKLSLSLGFVAALAVLVTRASQSRQHDKSESDSYYLLIYPSIHFLDQIAVDTSLIHIESHKSPTVELFDVDSRRISIHHCEY